MFLERKFDIYHKHDVMSDRKIHVRLKHDFFFENTDTQVNKHSQGWFLYKRINILNINKEKEENCFD